MTQTAGEGWNNYKTGSSLFYLLEDLDNYFLSSEGVKLIKFETETIYGDIFHSYNDLSESVDKVKESYDLKYKYVPSVYKDKIIYKDKTVYEDKIIYEEKIIEKDSYLLLFLSDLILTNLLFMPA